MKNYIATNYVNNGASNGRIREILLKELQSTFVPDIKKSKNRSPSFSTHLDTLITLHQRKLEKLQNIKKSCLEKMFV